ncbi:AAA family ATPase, partial [Amycolatopsis sp.]|uniref:AAA family ATPase n=1 Tax=Amycolatopsis sp. TaxID=37632 RepID=UPI002CF35D2F
DDKLQTYKFLLEKIELFRDIINARFRFKEMTIDKRKGFLFHFGEKEIGPDQLSSGEQHELVITYDLLFQVEHGSLVMVDEPEISLHVAWQQQFISDVRRIARLTGIRFIIATHSPQIIHTWHDRAIALSSKARRGGSR